MTEPRRLIAHDDRILIVDDLPENIRLLERVLASDSYGHIQGVTDARRALPAYLSFTISVKSASPTRFCSNRDH